MHEVFAQNTMRRWVISFLLVLGLHAALLAAVFHWPDGEIIEAGEPMAAMMIELAPMPTAPPTPELAATPGEMQQEVLPTPEPEPKVIEPVPDIAKVEKAEVTLPEKPEPQEVEKPIEQQPEDLPQQEQAPVSMDVPVDERSAAPRQGAVSLSAVDAAMRWQSILLGHLEKHKRYPRKSRRRRQEAVVYVRVEINRDGSLVSYRLERPGRYKLLNQESLDLIARAQPLPAPPQEVEGETVEFVVPVEFSLKR